MSRELRIILLFTVLSVFWGGSFIAIKETVTTIPPILGAAMRMLVATAALFFYFRFANKSIQVPKEIRWKIWGLGIVGIGAPFGFLFWGEQYISAGLGGIINGSVPIWTTLLVACSRDESERGSLHPKLIAGIALGFLGLVVIFYPLLESPGNHALWGAMSVVMMAICYSFGNVINRYYVSKRKDLDLTANLFHQHAASFVFLMFISLFTIDMKPEILSSLAAPRVLLSIGYLGVFSTAIALGIYFYLLREVGSIKTSAVTYVVPLFAVLLDFIFFSTKPSLFSLFGVLLIFAGVFMIRSQPAKENIGAGGRFKFKSTPRSKS